MRLKIAFVLATALSFGGCAYTPEEPLLQQQWASAARKRLAPAQVPLESTSIPARWKVSVSGGYGVSEGDFEDAQDLPIRTKVVARVDEGTHIQTESLDFENHRVEIVGKGADKSHLVFDAGARGLIMRGGTLVLRDLTISNLSSEGMVMLGGDVELDNVVINGSRHGIYISNGSITAIDSILAGNESGVDFGENCKAEFRRCIFLQNYEALSGEAPLQTIMDRCLVLGSVQRAFGARFGPTARLTHNVIVENREVGWKNVPDNSLKGNLIQQDGFAAYNVEPGVNRALFRFSEFPDGTPEGLPKDFPVAQFMLIQKRLETLGESNSVKAVKDFAEDEAKACIRRAKQFCEVKSWRKALILIEISEDFCESYPGLKSQLTKTHKEVRAAIKAGLNPQAPAQDSGPAKAAMDAANGKDAKQPAKQ